MAALNQTTLAFLERFNAARADRPARAPEPVNELRESYLTAACVLDQFDAEWLRPAGGRSDDAPTAMELLGDEALVQVPGTEPALHTLRLEHRRQALSQLKTREAMHRALSSNPRRIETPVQSQWEAFLETEHVPPLMQMSYAELGACRQWVSWVDGLLFEPALLKEVDTQWRRQSVTSGLEHLIKDGFIGRKSQLKTLREAAVPRGLQKPMLFVEGVGGVGKSSLIGKFLTQLTTRDEPRPLIAYMTLEDPSLQIEDPVRLIAEGIRQFRAQAAPSARAHLREAEASLKETFSYRRQWYEGAAQGSLKERLTSSQDRLRHLWERLDEHLEHAARENSQSNWVAIIVLDTWELVAKRAAGAMRGFWDMVEGITRSGWVRFVVAGRDSTGLRTRNAKRISLKALSPGDARLLLAAWETPKDAIAPLIKRFGTNPLTLRLVASIARNARGASELLTGNAVERSLVQGFLYKRILDRLQNEDVRKLAHPGMVLRRVDLDVIQDVLAPVCLDRFIDLEHATELFNQLASERGLMSSRGGEYLTFRPELRRSVLPLLKRDRPGIVIRLHEAAIEHYLQRDSIEDRTEEAYHRLMLGSQQFAMLEERWSPEVGKSLIADMEDMPKDAVGWLSARLNLRVDRAVIVNADTGVWERDVAAKVAQALRGLSLREAFSLLRERDDRTNGSPLFALEVKAYLLDEKYARALEAAMIGSERLKDAFEPWRRGEVLWLQAQAHMGLDRPDLADRALESAAELFAHPDCPVAQMHTVSQRISLRTVFGWQPAFNLTSDLVRIALQVYERRPHYVSGLMRRIVEQVSSDFPREAEQLASISATFGVEVTRTLLQGESLLGLEEFQSLHAGASGFPTHSASPHSLGFLSV
jgi:hypothetical protein